MPIDAAGSKTRDQVVGRQGVRKRANHGVPEFCSSCRGTKYSNQ
jgi:hypothetical protein